MLIITIDCGASFIKGAAFRDGIKQKVIRRSAPSVNVGASVYSVKQIIPLVHLVKQIILELTGLEREIVLCISNEMHGFILAYSDGQPCTDYISWQKEFGNIHINGKSAYQLLSENPNLQDDILYSGMLLRAGLPSSNLFYLLQTDSIPFLIDSTIHFYTLGSYLLKVLSGGQEPMEHATNAAATGLYDLRTSDWNKKYIEAMKAERIIFPKIGQEIMDFNFEGIKIHALPAIGDQQAALLGAGFVNDEDLSFNLGTGAQVSCLTEELDCATEYQIRPYFYGKLLKTIPHIPSGRALNVYFRFIKSVLEGYSIDLDEDDIWSGILSIANKPASSINLDIDLGFFENAVNNSVKGSITNIDEHSFVFSNLMFSVLCQMADNFISVADRLVPKSIKIKRIVFSGGLSRRFEIIKNRITEHYPQADTFVACDETLHGLYLYSILYYKNINS